MFRQRKIISVVLSILILFSTLLEVEAKEKSLKELIKRYETQILENVKAKEFRKGIIAAAEYEQELIARYSPATFQMNLFQCEAEHLCFHNSFVDWKQVDLKNLGIPEWLQMAGWNVLLALEGNNEDERLCVISVDLGKIERRMGLAEQGSKYISDQELFTIAMMMASYFGVVKNYEFKAIGDHRVLLLDIEPPSPLPPVYLVNLPSGRKLYMFMLTSPLRNQKENQKRLFELIKTVDLQYKPVDKESISKIHRKFDGMKDIPSILQCVRELAEIGEYNSAGDELARLRILLSECLPKPYIKGNQAQFPAYGVSFANPNENKWRLSIEKFGNIEMLLLIDKWSVKEEGIGIVVLDPLLVYGPQAVKAICGGDEEEKKQFLIDAGRGSTVSIGTIENERLTVIKNSLAYEAIVTTNIPGMKAKCVCMMPSEFIVGMLMMADTNKFEAKIAEYEKIIQGDCLTIDGIKKAERR